jgi:hypothetical protein
MNLVERVLHFLRKRIDEPYCDECLGLELGTKHSLSRMLGALSSDYFRRGPMTCCRCGENKPGIVQIRSDTEGPISIN